MMTDESGALSPVSFPRQERHDDVTAVFVEAGRTSAGLWRYVRRDVRVSDTGAADWVVVPQGLRPGDRVVTFGAAVLSGRI